MIPSRVLFCLIIPTLLAVLLVELLSIGFIGAFVVGVVCGIGAARCYSIARKYHARQKSLN